MMSEALALGCCSGGCSALQPVRPRESRLCGDRAQVPSTTLQGSFTGGDGMDAPGPYGASMRLAGIVGAAGRWWGPPQAPVARCSSFIRCPPAALPCISAPAM